MLASKFTPHLNQNRIAQSAPGPAALLRAMIDPAVVIGTLAAAVLWFGGRFDGPYLILALIVFSMTFPSSFAPPPGIHGSGAAELARDIAGGWLVISVLLVLLGWASRTLDYFDQRAILTWLLATPAVLFAAHRLAPVLLPRLLRTEALQRTAVIAGASAHGCRLAERLRGDPLSGVRVAGYFDDRDAHRTKGIAPLEDLGALAKLPEYVKKHRVDVIYIALPMASQPRILKLLEELHDTTASIYFAPDIFLFDLIQARVDTVGGIPVLAVCESPFYGIDGLVKRLSDIVLASLILVAITPLMLAIALGIKLGSPGPVLFRQRRYGLDGQEILVYKFRSMTVTEDGPVVKQATKNDSRVTPFGAFLRRTSLDELPQFINVLQGRMSVVGPRPHAVAHNELYRRRIRGYMIRHKVRPGITGLAQVNGFRGETDTLEKMEGRIEYDLAYLRNWSLWLDLKIVLQTVAVVLRRQNAY